MSYQSNKKKTKKNIAILFIDSKIISFDQKVVKTLRTRNSHYKR